MNNIELNQDGTIKSAEVEYVECTGTASTSTWTACLHDNGTFFSVKFWIFRKRLFFCEDCHACFDEKFIKALRKFNKK